MSGKSPSCKRKYWAICLSTWPGSASQAAQSSRRHPKSDAWDRCLGQAAFPRHEANGPYVCCCYSEGSRLPVGGIAEMCSGRRRGSVPVPEFSFLCDFHMVLDCIVDLFVKKSALSLGELVQMGTSFDLVMEFYIFPH